MDEFKFCAVGKDKFNQQIRLGDIIMYGGGTQSQSNVAFAFVTKIRDCYGNDYLINYSPISDDLSGFRSQGNNKSKWGRNVIRIPSEWDSRFSDVRKKYNKKEFGNENPTQFDIDEHFSDKEYDEYEKLHHLGKYAPDYKKIDRDFWKGVIKYVIEDRSGFDKKFTKRLFVNAKQSGELDYMWNSGEEKSWKRRIMNHLNTWHHVRREKEFKNDYDMYEKTMRELFEELVNDWENER